MIGAPSYMAGPNYLMDKDIVFVSFNYRLAIFGILFILIILSYSIFKYFTIFLVRSVIKSYQIPFP